MAVHGAEKVHGLSVVRAIEHAELLLISLSVIRFGIIDAGLLLARG
jgi:hypothetical protein